MLLFHGTSGIRGTEIIKSGLLKIDAPKVYDENHDLPTTDGYIYLSNTLTNAIYYGNKTTWIDKDHKNGFYIFELEVDDNLIEADKDEFKYLYTPEVINCQLQDPNNPSIAESLHYTKSVRVSKDLSLKDCKARYINLPSTQYEKDESEELRQLRKDLYKVVGIYGEENETVKEFLSKLFSKFIWSEF